jgi:hypothetical protein
MREVAPMTAPMREFDWSYEIGMYAGTAAGVLALVLVVGGLILLVRALLGRISPRRSDQP